MKKWFFLPIVLVLVGCDGDNRITSPSRNNVDAPQSGHSNPDLRYMEVSVQRVSNDTIRVYIRNNVRLGIDPPLEAGDSLSGGQITLEDVSCSNSVGRYSVGYANGTPHNGSDTTVFSDFFVGSCGDIRFGIRIESFNYVRYRDRGSNVLHTLNYTDLVPGTLRKSGRSIVGRMSDLPPAS